MSDNGAGHWESSRLDEICDIIRGLAFPTTDKSFVPSDGTIACLRTTNVQREVEWDDLWFIPTKHVRNEAQIVRPGDILISTANSFELVGKVAQVKEMPHRATLGAFISLIRPSESLNRSFVFYQLSSNEVQRAIRAMASTTTNISNVSTGKLRDLDLRVAPRPEQDRIVAEIEKQFTRLDAATTALKRVQANLKRYRASVLKAACEGRLTDRARISRPYDNVAVAEVLREPLANGRSPEGSAEGYRILRLTAIRNGLVNPDESRRGIVADALVGKLSIRRNDVLISRGNGSKSLVGLAGLVGNSVPESEPVLFPDTVIRARLNIEFCDPRFFVLIWNSRFVRDQIERTARTTAGIHKISQTDIERFQIPLPPIQAQAVIVTAVEQALSNVQHTDEALAHLLARSASLRSSILAAAFSGQLVPGNPSDAPASALLENIRTERQEANQKPRKNQENLVVTSVHV